MVVVVAVSWRKSSRTVLLHLGHFGSSSESITYIRHLGHPTRTMDVASGLLEYLTLASTSWFISDDTHELGGDVGDTVADRLGDSTLGLSLGGDRFSFNSSLGPFLRLIFISLRIINLKGQETLVSLGVGGEKRERGLAWFSKKER